MPSRSTRLAAVTTKAPPAGRHCRGGVEGDSERPGARQKRPGARQSSLVHSGQLDGVGLHALPSCASPLREPLRGAALANPLVETKLYLPRLRRSFVARPRLNGRLSRGSDARLTLISAPAGFGKTTLLTAWLAAAATENRSVAWLSLEESCLLYTSDAADEEDSVDLG